MTYHTLIAADELARRINEPDWVIVDCRFDLAKPESGRAAYALSHLPNARYAHLNSDLSAPIAPSTGRHPLPNPQHLAQRLGAWGINTRTQVVAYDDSGGPFAARLWWLLRWLGHERVAVLDGGLKRWTAQSLPLSSDTPHVTPTAFTPHVQSMAVDVNTVQQRLNDARYTLIDVRAPERFAGTVEPIDPVAGHVPGARNIPFAQNLDPHGCFKSADELRALYEQHVSRVDPQRLMVMCGSGVTACHTVLALEVAGLAGAQLYAGSWSEWITDPSRPVARGL